MCSFHQDGTIKSVLWSNQSNGQWPISPFVIIRLVGAFDTVNYYILISTFFGITGKSLQWFGSYLMYWTQSIFLSGDMTTPQKLTTGVPQGSVLGLLLFTLQWPICPFVSTRLVSRVSDHRPWFHMSADVHVSSRGTPKLAQKLSNKRESNKNK